jgi:ParB family chromosome partitioning protein
MAMREFKRLPIASLRPDPDQPRKTFDEAELRALAESMKQHGQQVPVIVYEEEIPEPERSKQ